MFLLCASSNFTQISFPLVLSALYLVTQDVGISTFCAQLHILIQVSRVCTWMWVLWTV